MILTDILRGKKYGVIQAVLGISHDFLFLAIKLNCADRFSSKNDMLKVILILYLKMCKALKKFTEENVRKSSVNFAFSGYADIINIRKNLHFHASTCRLLKLAPSGFAQS